MKRNIVQHDQHFLRGPAFIAELIGHSNIRKNNLVLDVGAGSGAITDVLARRARRVIAYEVESRVLELLRQNMTRRDNVMIEPRDFLHATLPTEPYKVFSNIPFRLSSSIVRKLAFADNPPLSMYFIVQKQFAQKLIMTGDHFHGALGAAISPWWVARVRRPLRKTDFTPPPAVDTVLLELKPRETTLLSRQQMESYVKFVEACFADPKVYAKAHGPRDKKPSQLRAEEWVALFSRYI